MATKTKEMNRRLQLLVYGYCRNIENVMFIEEIIDFCVDYYIEPEAFDPDHIYDDMMIDANDPSVIYPAAKPSYDHGTWATVFGKTIIKKNEIFCWNFEIVGQPEEIINTWKVAIGVTSSTDTKEYGSFRSFIKESNYALIGSEPFLRENGNDHRIEQKFGENEGDTLRMTLNMKEFTLSFVINGQENGYCIDDLEYRHYRLAVSLCLGRKLKLVSAGWL